MIAQWLAPEAMELVGQAMYIVSALATLAIAIRLFIVWRRWQVSIAGGMVLVCLLFVFYWLYCLVRIYTGCLTDTPNVDSYLCSELAWWTRIIVAMGLSIVAWWLWKLK